MCATCKMLCGHCQRQLSVRETKLIACNTRPQLCKLSYKKMGFKLINKWYHSNIKMDQNVIDPINLLTQSCIQQRNIHNLRATVDSSKKTPYCKRIFQLNTSREYISENITNHFGTYKELQSDSYSYKVSIDRNIFIPKSV